MQEENPKAEQRVPQSWVRAAPLPDLLLGCILRSNFNNTQSEKWKPRRGERREQEVGNVKMGGSSSPLLVACSHLTLWHCP